MLDFLTACVIPQSRSIVSLAHVHLCHPCSCSAVSSWYKLATQFCRPCRSLDAVSVGWELRAGSCCSMATFLLRAGSSFQNCFDSNGSGLAGWLAGMEMEMISLAGAHWITRVASVDRVSLSKPLFFSWGQHLWRMLPLL